MGAGPYVEINDVYDKNDEDPEGYNKLPEQLSSQPELLDKATKVQIQKMLNRKKEKTEKFGIVDEDFPIENNEEWDIVYCLPIMVKPGNHQYLIKYKDTDEALQ